MGLTLPLPRCSFACQGPGPLLTTAASYAGGPSMGRSAQGCSHPQGPTSIQPACLCADLRGSEGTIQVFPCTMQDAVASRGTLSWHASSGYGPAYGTWPWHKPVPYCMSEGKQKGQDSAHPPFKYLAPRFHVLRKQVRKFFPSVQTFHWLGACSV